MEKIKIGMIGTSWWADSMYLPALTNHPNCEVVATSGRNRERAEAFAELWNIPKAYTDYNQMMDEEELDAVVIATGNDSHHPITMVALAKGLHVLCEKPLAMDVAQAEEMAQLAVEKGVKTCVPFTYRFMPTNRYLKELVDDGYIGKPYHMAMRYYTGYGRDTGYLWRFDKELAGSGVIGDLGSHFLYVAEWVYGPIKAITCQTGTLVDRGDTNPAGEPYEQLEDSAYFLLEFENGAHGSIHVTCVAHEQTKFGQRHFMEFHGSEGTLYQETDWNNKQEVRGAKGPDGELEILPIPDHIWGKARRDVVHDTYKDVFRQDLLMIGEWIDSIVNDAPADPNFADGLRIQKVMDAALKSAEEKRQILIG
ncbi:MAG: putative dehydrogenase [Cellvibrionaceae bacterium]|jgi:predicted dehydrogenase